MSGQQTSGAPDVTQREFVGRQKLFGRYTLIRILGRGGMGIVWLARDEELERDVALKFLPDLIIQDAAVRNDLKRETRRCLELTHKNIVRIYDFVHDERSGCISMEYVDGDTLSNLRCDKERKVFEAVELTEWISQLCDALDYAHNYAHVVHRDLKPANLMVNQHGELKLSDFGIARSLGDSMSVITMQQGRSGTLAYMSPQQLEGEYGTHLDDIYSLGASVYELLTSKPPFYAGNVDRQIREKIPPSMMERRKELEIEGEPIPAVWEEWVAACLAKDPARRPQSVTEIARQLQMPLPEAHPPSVSSFFARKKKRVLALVTLAGVVVIASAIAGLFLLPRGAARNIDKSIAVLPFENLSDDKENAYFAGGIQDDVLVNLSKIRDLKVISRTSTMQYKGNPRNVREIGRALDVAAVLEGSVRRSGNRVRVNVQLINTSNDEHIWAEVYDRELTDVFAIQNDLAIQIASTLQTKLSPVEKARLQQRPTTSEAAYLIYLQAQDAYARSQSRDDLEKVAQLYQQAIQVDPSFALALARLSYVESTLYLGTANPAVLDKARAAANEALRLQPALPEAHLALGYLYYRGDRDYERALQELAVATIGLPNDADIFLVTGSIERRRGKWSQSTADLEKAASLSPKDASIWANIGSNYQSLGNFLAAAKAFDRGIATDPSFFMTRYLRARLDIEWKGDTGSMERLLTEIPETSDPDGNVTLARFQLKMLQRKYDEALQALSDSMLDSFTGWVRPIPVPKPLLFARAYRLLNEKAKARYSYEEAQYITERAVHENPLDASRHALLGQIYAGLDRKDDAIHEGKRAVELTPELKDAVDGPQMILALAQIYTMVGDLDSAIALLEHSLTTPGGITVPLLKLDPAWDPLRHDPRFKKIVASLAAFR